MDKRIDLDQARESYELKQSKGRELLIKEKISKLNFNQLKRLYYQYLNFLSSSPDYEWKFDGEWDDPRVIRYWGVYAHKKDNDFVTIEPMQVIADMGLAWFADYLANKFFNLQATGVDIVEVQNNYPRGCPHRWKNAMGNCMVCQPETDHWHKHVSYKVPAQVILDGEEANQMVTEWV